MLRIWSNEGVQARRIQAERLFTLVIFCAASALAQQNDWLIVPGKRLGPITPDTRRADLDRLFGKANVRDQPVDKGEGPDDATVVFPDLPAEGLAIFWSQSGNGEVELVQICYQLRSSSCRWHTENGATLGTDLQKLEKLNGRAFQIELWDYDAGGNISSWRGGKLASVFENGGTTWGGYPSRLMLTVEPRKGSGPQLREILDVLEQQKRPLLSNDPAIRPLDPAVTRMTLSLPSRTHVPVVR